MQDLDPVETQEWLDALESVLDKEGEDRAHYLMTRMGELATRSGSQLPYAITTPYRNTIPVTHEARMPGDLFMERRIRSLVRWNAMAMVMRTNLKDSDLGGHISSFASSDSDDIASLIFPARPTSTAATYLLPGPHLARRYARAFRRPHHRNQRTTSARKLRRAVVLPDLADAASVSSRGIHGSGPIPIYRHASEYWIPWFHPEGNKILCFWARECDEPDPWVPSRCCREAHNLTSS